ncbi:MAG: TIR domain-containing protein [Dehalococcoidia bacterium]|nr:TIR domain-containing protein [Dehalococcoidia bacterium]
MPYLKTYDLFISHAWDHNEEYERLVNMLNTAPYFKWRNYSVPRTDPLPGGRTLGAQLDGQVRPVNAVIILAGMYVNHRDWIQKEIDLAQGYRKPIIGLYPWGQERAPVQVTQVAVEMVRWNTDSIISAIRTHAL